MSALTASIGALVAVFIATASVGPLADARASEQTTISDVRVTNVRATSFTVSWTTSGDATGHIIYATAPTTLTETAYDARGPSFEDDTHYVTVVQLTDETLYYFDVLSAGTRDDNGGAHYAVTTGPVLTTTAGLDTAYGQVWQADGFTEAAGTIVYVTLADADGSGHPDTAAPMSALVEPNGWWSANLGNARRANLRDYFDYSQSGDELQLHAQGAGDGEGTVAVDTLHAAPAPDIVLSIILTPTNHADVFLPLVLSAQGGESVGTSAASPRTQALGAVSLTGGHARSKASAGYVGTGQ